MVSAQSSKPEAFDFYISCDILSQVHFFSWHTVLSLSRSWIVLQFGSSCRCMCDWIISTG